MNKSILLSILFAFSASAFAVNGTSQVSEVFIAGSDNSEVTGAATLKRNSHGISGRIMTKVSFDDKSKKSSQKHLPFTVWLVIFNKPENCAGDSVNDAHGQLITFCTLDDVVPGGLAGAAVINGSGAIVQNMKGGGVLNADFSLKVGDDAYPCCFGKLENPNAEVHVVVDKHADFTSWPLI